jgi:tetratricopeptide (TPR) repeat protein
LYSRTDLAKLAVARRWVLGMAHLRCLMLGRHLDAAAREADAFVKVLPPQDQLFPPDDYINMRNGVRAMLDEAHAGMMSAELNRMSPVDRAKGLMAPRQGSLTLEAIAALQAAPNLPAEGRRMLADLLLRVGRPAEAREAYRAASADGAEAGAVALRLALCDWVEGDLWRALDALGGLDGAGPVSPPGTGEAASTPSTREGLSPRRDPLREYYRALLLEEMGYYPQARDALRAATNGAGPGLTKLIEQARGRL